jgi:hypothetical protein
MPASAWRITLAATRLNDRREVFEWSGRQRAQIVGREAQPDLSAPAGVDGDPVMRGDFGPRLGGIHRIGQSVDEIFVDRILDPGTRVRLAEEPLGVCVVVGEQQRRALVAVEVALTQLGVGRGHVADVSRTFQSPQSELGCVTAPGPGVAKPERPKHVERGGRGAAIGDGEKDEDVLR